MKMTYQRLKKRRQFVLLSKLGSRFITPSFIMLCLKQTRQFSKLQPKTDSPRIGFTVTKRLGKAVDRNFIKRRLRAASAETLNEFAQRGYDYVVIARKDATLRKFTDLVDDFRRSFKFFSYTEKEQEEGLSDKQLNELISKKTKKKSSKEKAFS
ncbi:MAG: ribonuclease P protein component [Alphaproteobacteria bacterium]|nr:ribonuclease P protein component [Alphaproteobacteria bacterium]